MFSSLLVAAALFVSAQASTAHSATFDVPPGQEIRMDLSAGEYEIVGAADSQVRVSWSSRNGYDADRVHVKVRFKPETGRAYVETEHTKDVRVRIQVPFRSHLHIRLSAGELSVSGVEGNKDIGLIAGELRVNVGDPANYKDVRSSVRIGEITATPFNVRKEGFFREFDRRGKGAYLLRATVGVGEVHLAR